MADISRRWFLGGSIALTAATVIPLTKLIPSIPAIYADGINDDLAGLQALFNRKPVDIIGDATRIIRAETIEVIGGNFRLSNTLILAPNTNIRDAHFTFFGDKVDYMMMYVPSKPAGMFQGGISLGDAYRTDLVNGE